ncbi:MAG: hypothetical protein H3C62_07175 [Gemmatimonadaceae bacterium]|nr:hypothetical protein [Gemmatimonadaceae bacterium]
MKRRVLVPMIVAAVTTAWPSTGAAQHHHNVTLHVSDRWKECAFQLDPSLTQDAWRQFTREAGLVTYFRPLTDARPMGRGRVEFSLMQSMTAIDDTDAAWNDTFVHPDSTHWLHEGTGLPVPGVIARAGVTDRLDVGAYFTRNPNSNYGFAGVQAQYSLRDEATSRWSTAARVSAVSLFGPEDLSVRVVGADLMASRSYPIYSTWASVAPYAGVSAYLSASHEKSAVVALRDERVFGAQGTIGAAARVAKARIAVEYNVARVWTRTFKVGMAF